MEWLSCLWLGTLFGNFACPAPPVKETIAITVQLTMAPFLPRTRLNPADGASAEYTHSSGLLSGDLISYLSPRSLHSLTCSSCHSLSCIARITYPYCAAYEPSIRPLEECDTLTPAPGPIVTSILTIDTVFILFLAFRARKRACLVSEHSKSGRIWRKRTQNRGPADLTWPV